MGIRILVPRPKRGSLLRKPNKLLWLALGLAVWGTAYTLFGAGGLIGVLQASSEVERLEAEVVEAETANRELARQIEALRGNPEAIERAAREQLYMARPDEKVYLLPPADSTDTVPGTTTPPGTAAQR